MSNSHIKSEVVSICVLRHESSLGCANCIYWNKPAKKCLHERITKEYTDSFAENRKNKK